MENAGGGVSARNLDTRLLRFRNRPSTEDGGELASELLGAGRTTEALEVASAALGQAPEDARLHLVEGQAWLKEGDLIRAQAALLKAARFAPQDKEPFRWLGEVLLKRGDPARAVKVLERAIAIDPHDRAIELLHKRAERFARIADEGGVTEAGRASKAAFEPPGSIEPPDTRVERGRLSEPDVEEEPDTRVAKPDIHAVDTRVASPDIQAVATRVAKASPGPELVDFDEDDDEVPTVIADRSSVERALGPGVVSAFTSPGSRNPKHTMLGMGGATGPGAPGVPSAPAPLPPPPSSGLRPAPPPRREPAPPPPASARAKRTMVGLGQPGAKREAPAKPFPKPPEREANRPDGPFGADPFASSAVFEDATTDARMAPAARLDRDRLSGDVARPAEREAPRREPPARAGAFASPPSPPRPPSFAPPPASPSFASPPPAFGSPRSERPVLAAPEPTPRFDEDEPEPFDPMDDEETVQAAPDLLGGEHAGAREDVDGVLRMLEQEGIFERPSGEPAKWASRKESKTAGTRVGVVLAIAWVVTVLLAVGGWFGWQEWIAHRHSEADRMVAEAAEKALEGDHADLVDAERMLRVARDLDPHGVEGPEVMLFVHAQRALEDGAFEPGYLRPAIQRGTRMNVSSARVKAAEAVLAAAEGNMDAARANVTAALETGGEDAAVLYMAGRTEQRLGEESALPHLEQAIEKAPDMSAAVIALAEARADEGRREAAIALLEGIRERHPNHLRATLWQEFVTADETDAAEGLDRVGQLAERLEQGAPTDRVLVELTRARLLRRQGALDGAAEAVDRAGQAGSTEPRLLALVASEAKAVGRLSLAQAAATNAVAGAPTNADFRKLLAQILIDRRDGVRALRTLGAMSMDDPEVLRMSAESALIVGTPDALRAAAEELAKYVAETEEPGIEIRALRIRTAVLLGQARDVLDDARQLAAEAPGDPVAARALGEAALAAYDAGTATEALGRLVQAAPEDADAHYLLGRARRMNAETEESEVSFRRALALLPEHTEARLALGRLLLDQGKFAEADELYQELARQSGIASGASTALLGRLGRIEALVGLGRVDDASVQMESVREQDRETPLARIATAQVALAKNRPGEAVSALRPLAEAEEPQADVVALFGDALFAAGEIEAANQQYERALLVDRGLPEALLGKANVAVRAENTADAADYLERLSESLDQRIRPPRMRAHMHLLGGRSALQDGRARREQARDALRRAVAIEGVPAEAWFWLGEALSGENAPESRAAYEKYIELDPNGPYASRARRAVR